MSDIVDIVKMLYSKPLSELSRPELEKRYEDLMNTFIGVLIGSAMTTSEIKELLKK